MSVSPKIDVAGIGDPGNADHARTNTGITDPGYNSRKVYAAGEIHPDVRVPFREISLAPTKTMSGEIEVNEPVRVYDTSGSWGDPDFHGDVEQGLPLLRARWIRDRGDVETVAGRSVAPADDGWLSDAHAKHAQRRNGSSKSQAPSSRETPRFKGQNSIFAARKPVRAKPGNCVTQLAYARQGVITPEMEFIAIRESGRAVAANGSAPRTYDRRNGEDRRSQSDATEDDVARNDLRQQHRGEAFGASIPREITPDFVRDEVARGRAIIPAN